MKDNLAVYLLRMNWYERAILEKAIRYHASKYWALDPKFLPLVKRADAVAAIERAALYPVYPQLEGPGIRSICAENLLCKLSARPLERNIWRRDRTLPKYRYLAISLFWVLEACNMEW